VKGECLRRVERIARETGTRLAAFALSVAAEEPAAASIGDASLLNPYSLDNLYLELFTRSLELLLFHCPMLDLKQQRISVFAADRQTPVDGATLERWRAAFGVQAVLGGYRSMPFDGVFRLLPPLFSAHGKRGHAEAIDRARAVKMEYLERLQERAREIAAMETELATAPGERAAAVERRLNRLGATQAAALAPRGLADAPKQIHYVADWIAKVGKFLEPDRVPEPMRSWFQAGFVQDFTPEFKDQLSACRGRRPLDGLLRLLPLREAAAAASCSALDWLLHRAAEWPEKLSGDDLRHLFRRFR
jgi:hypothetical protein